MYRPAKYEKFLLNFIESYEERYPDDFDLSNMVKADGKSFRQALEMVKRGDFYQAGEVIGNMDTAPRDELLDEIVRNFPKTLSRFILRGAGCKVP